jgi:hypothetical protein
MGDWRGLEHRDDGFSDSQKQGQGALDGISNSFGTNKVSSDFTI